MDVEKILEMLEKEDVPFNVFKRPQVAKESLVSACNGDYDAINRLLEEDIAIDERVYNTRPAKRFSRSSKESIGRVAKESLETEKLSKFLDKALNTSTNVIVTGNLAGTGISSELKNWANSVGVNLYKVTSYDNIPSSEVVLLFDEFDRADRREVQQAKSLMDRQNVLFSIILAQNSSNVDATVRSKSMTLNIDDILQGRVAKEDSTPIGVYNPIPSPVRKKANEETLSDKMIRALDSGSATESTSEKSPMKGSTDDIVKNKPINFKSQNNKFETQKAPETGKACAMTEKQTQKAAGEELISTKEDSIFPEELDFDTAAFAELFGLNEEDISAMYVEEEDNIPEHIEIRFKEGENEVLLQLMDDGSLIEEVNAEIVENPRFSASIEQDDEGNYILLVSDATDTVDEADDVVKSEEDSEGLDEEGLDRTEEFIEGAGLDLDSEYANTHNIKPAKDATTKIKDPTQLPVNK